MGKRNKDRTSTFEVERNHNYTISVKDSKGRVLNFRDMLGSDLEYIETCLTSTENGERSIDFDGMVKILNHLNTDHFAVSHLPKRIIIQLFKSVNEHIITNYIPKQTWLRYCYAIQNGSFANLAAMEAVPMTKFIAMVQIHQDAIETLNKNT